MCLQKAMSQLQALLALDLSDLNVPTLEHLKEVTTMPSMSSISSHEVALPPPLPTNAPGEVNLALKHRGNGGSWVRVGKCVKHPL